MRINWILDGEDIDVDRDPAEPLSIYLHEIRLNKFYVCQREFVQLESRAFPTDMLYLFRIRDKEVVTATGFLSTPDGILMQNIFTEKFGAVCPQCFSQRLFIMDIDLEHYHNFSQHQIYQSLSMIPCVCGREDEYVETANLFFKIKEQRRGPR